MARSDMWRGRRHSDRSKEVAHVTRGITHYFGTAADDRTFDVSWQPMQDRTLGMTLQGEKTKSVKLNPRLIANVPAPFEGELVDAMVGVAAHEAGHVLLAKMRLPIHSASQRRHMIQNVCEDILIDCGKFSSYNRALGKLTMDSRQYTRVHDSEEKNVLEAWSKLPSPMNADNLLNLWACSRLYGFNLPNTRAEYSVAEQLQAESLRLDAGKSGFTTKQTGELVYQVSNDIYAILEQYEQDNAAALQQRREEQKQRQQEKQDNSSESEPSEGEDDTQSEADSATRGEQDSGETAGASDGSEDASEKQQPSEGESESADSAKSESQSEGAGGDGAGDSSEDSFDIDAPLPPVCPNESRPDDPIDEELEDEAFWQGVQEELGQLEINQAPGLNRKALGSYVSRGIVNQIKKEYMALASEPDVTKRRESGRFDGRRMFAADYAEDLFKQNRDVKLDGKLVMVLDMSGSTMGETEIIKRIAASFYVALQTTEIEQYIFSYGASTRELATPTKVSSYFQKQGSNGGTPTGAALNMVLNTVKAHRTSESIILHVTDGQPNDMSYAVSQMKRAESEGWKVVNIFVGVYGKPPEQMTKVAYGNQAIKNYAELPKIVAATVRAIVAKKKGEVKHG